MPQVLTGVIARPFAGRAFVGYVETLARAFASAMELSRPAERERAVHWCVLGLMLSGAAFVRFWGLGAVGLHGDEETMAMAVRGILEQGAPVLPSGMFYPRGMTQLALMSLSIAIFGESEWALRLPSALCGVALVPIGYFVGRRFLRPTWSLALAAALAFLPELIVYSQTGRMYIFLVTFITASMACTFAWERTGRTTWLVGAIVALIFGLEMHSLAIASVLMLMFPGVVNADARKIVVGSFAMIAVVVGFVLIETFVNAQYPEPPADFAPDAVAIGGAKVTATIALPFQLALAAAAVALAFVGARVCRAHRASESWLAAGLLIVGIVLQFFVFYHLAALFYLVGFAAAVRHGALRDKLKLAVLGAGIVTLALVHMMLVAPAAQTFIQVIGALIGQPSVWPYARVAQFSLTAGALWGVLLLWGVWLFATRKRLPDYWVIAFLGVWCPMFALGLFTWDTPVRYTAMSLIPMLLVAFALAQRGVDALWRRTKPRTGHGFRDALCASIVGVCVVNPSAVLATVDAGYARFPDHKGAAEFVRQQNITEEDVVLVEDILQQTYYLGRVDYWLIGPQVARRFVMKSEDEVVDFYTGTPVIVTPEMLDKVLQDHRDKRVFIVGTGEGWRDGRRPVRGALESMIQSDRFETVYLGRDGLTRVLRAVPSAAPVPTPAMATTKEESKKVLAKSAEAALEEANAEEAAQSSKK